MGNDDGMKEKPMEELNAVRTAPAAKDEIEELVPDSVSDGVWNWNIPTGKFAYSPKLRKMFGISDEEGSCADWLSRVHPEEAKVAENHLKAVAAGGKDIDSSEYRVRCRDGTYKWALVKGIASTGDDGIPVAVTGLVSDVTEYKEADHRFRKMAETIPASIFIIQDGRICYVNPYTELKSGYTAHELFAMHPWACIHPDAREMVRKRTLSPIQGGPTPSRYEVRLAGKAGQEFFGDMSTTTITYRRKPAIMGVIYDITERKRGEGALRESESKYRALFQNANDAIFLMKGETIIDCNEKALEMFGSGRGQIVGKTPYDLSPATQPGEGRSGNEPHMRVAAALSGASQYFEWRHRRHDGTLFDAEVSLARVDLDGTRFLHCIIRDITDRKMREDALRESEQKFRGLAEKSLVGIYLIQDSVFRYVNSKFAEILGYTAHEMIETIKHEETVFPEDRANVVERLRKRTTGDVPSMRHEFRVVTRKGDVRNVEVYGSRTIYQGRPAVIGTLLDVTERTRSEELLRQAEEKYRSIFENSIEGIFQITPEGRITVANKAMAKMFGYDRAEEMVKDVGSGHAHFFSRPGERLELKRIIDQDGSVKGFQTEMHRRDGKMIWVSINGRAVKGQDGSILRYEGTIEDTTEQQRAEERLRRSEAGLRALIGSMNDIIAIVNKDGRYMRIDLARPDKLFMSSDKPFRKTLREAIPGETEGPFLAAVTKALKTRATVNIEYNVEVEGEKRWFSTAISPMTDDATVCVARDITDTKIAENELHAKSLSLEETNNALKVLLHNMEGAKKELEENVVSNIRVLVKPYLEKMARLKLGSLEKAYVDAIETGLRNISSPFLHGLSQFNLTPTEIQVANYIRAGHTTKEIVELLHGTKDSVDMHRYHIRKKLGLNKSKTNLRSYLLSIH